MAHPRRKKLDREWLLASSLTVDSGCRVWRLARDRYGYGRIKTGGSHRGAHRVSYELFVGPIPDGMHLDHVCRNRCCINPDHLRVVTPVENVMLGRSSPALNAAKTHCKRGHPLSGANLYLWGRSRICRTCRAMYEAQRRSVTPPESAS
jgi:hypothetical protein